MPVLNSIKRRLIEHLAPLVTELHVGSDGPQASETDGGVRSLGFVTPTVKIIDDSTLEVKGTFDASYAYATDIEEVYLQYKDSSTNEFVPIYRAAIDPLTKNSQNEISFTFLLEVD